MLERLRQPEGRLGTLSLVSASVLALVGTLGVVSLLVSLAVGSTWFWSDNPTDKVIGVAFFAVTLLGAGGFVVMDQAPALGAVLGVLGGLAMALVLFWALVPVVLGVGAAVVAVLRARALSHRSRPLHA